MLATTMQSAVAQTVRACGRTLPVKSLATSRTVLSRRTFLIAPGYKTRLSVRSFATATATKSTTTTKKPAAKKATSKTRKPATTKKATAIKRKKPAAKAKAKAKPKKKTPKPPSERALKLQKARQKTELRKVALLNQEPKLAPRSAWQAFFAERIRGQPAPAPGAAFGNRTREVAAEFRNLSASEKERFDEQAQKNKIQNAANFKKWVEGYTIAEIHAANLARRRLIKDFGAKVNPAKIVDERKPKQPVTAFSQFIRARSPSTEGNSAPEKMKTLSAEWKALSATEKKPYEDLFAAENIKYKKEQERIGL